MNERDPEAHREDTLRETAAISEEIKHSDRVMREAVALTEEHLNSAGKLPPPAAALIEKSADEAPPEEVKDYDDLANFMMSDD